MDMRDTEESAPAAQEQELHTVMPTEPFNVDDGGDTDVSAPDVKVAAAAIGQLNDEQLCELVDMVPDLALGGRFTKAPFVVGQWYLPKVVPATAEGCGLSLTRSRGCTLRMCGREFSLNIQALLLRAFFLICVWVALYNLLPSFLMSPGGYLFDPFVTVVLAIIIGGGLCRMVNLPPLVGILVVSIIWNNIPPQGHLTEGIVPEFRKACSALGLVVILTRAGLSLNTTSLRSTLANSLALATLPFITEAVIHALMASALFGHNALWSALQGVTASAVAPAVVVPSVLQLQSEGYGKTRGPLPLMLSSVTVDMTLGIWGVNFCVDLLFDTGTNLGLLIALAPIQIIGGLILGFVEGVMVHLVMRHVLLREATPLPGRPTRFVAAHEDRAVVVLSITMLFTGLATVGIAGLLKVSGGGALAVITCAGTIAHLWTTQSGPHDAVFRKRKDAVAAWFAFVWDTTAMPLLFSMVGSTVILSNLFGGYFFWRALLCLLIGMVGRAVMSPLMTFGLGFSKKELATLVMGWIGKASVQGAVGALAYFRAKDVVDGSASPTKSELEDLESATIIRDQALLAILIAAPLSAILLTTFGRKLLDKGDA